MRQLQTYAKANLVSDDTGLNIVKFERRHDPPFISEKITSENKVYA